MKQKSDFTTETIEEFFNDVFDHFNESKYSTIKDKDGNDIKIQINHVVGSKALKEKN